MKALLYVSLTLYSLISFTGSRAQSRVESIAATEFLAYGRTALLADKTLELIGSGSHFGFSFEGKECRLFTSLSEWQDHNYLQYELDGVYQKRLLISKYDSSPIVIKANGEGRHTIWIYKATEAHSGSIFLQRVEGEKLQVVKNAATPLIEFIGNSITCGAASDPAEVPCGTGVYHDQHNAYLAYGPRLARLLQVNFILSSVSGIGIYRNWNSDGPTMPQVYEKTDFQYNGNRYWNFSNYNPAVVSIALGTNDFSNGDGKAVRRAFDSAAFVSGYIRFVQLVRAKYPQAKIALLSSPMVSGHNRELLQNCLSAVKSSINSTDDKSTIALYFFKPMQASGCSGHPSVDDHRILAEELKDFFQSLLKGNVKPIN